MITGKKFDIDGVIKEVVKEDETFVYFDGGVAIKKYLLGTKYEEYLDPSTFFNSSSKTMMDIADKIKKHDGPVNESNSGGTQVNMQNVYQKQNHVEDKVVPPVTKFNPNQNQTNIESQHYEFNNQNQNTNHSQQQNVNSDQNQNTYTYYPPQHIQENPEEALFKKLKRNTKAIFEIKIEEMVPTADFIRMMNDNFETSIIDFLSKQAVEKLLRDPDKLRKQIKAQLETTVYGAPIEDEVEEEIEKPKVVVVEETIEEKPIVAVIEEASEEIVEEKPTVSIVSETVEETIETPVVTIIEEPKAEAVEESVAPIVETNEKDLSAE